ncbi:MAG: carboxypeptidase-like regulatory domain-containing protein [bacterium]
MPAKTKFFILILLSFVIINSSSISGYVYDKDTKKPIPFCNVLVQGGTVGDIGDESGYYSLSNLQEGRYTLIVNIIGYSSDTQSIMLGKDDFRKVDFTIKHIAIEMKGQEITGERADFTKTISISKDVYKKENFDFSPQLIEPDIMRVLQLLPSVVASSDFSSALYVRGGSPDQNLILYDNSPIMNPFHLGGVLSTFETNAVKEAEFYAGGFPQSYPNRLSSVIDVKSINPTKDDFHAVLDASILAVNLFLESKIYDGLSFFVSGRRTYFDKILPLINFDFPYYFYDITAKLDYSPNKNTRAAFTYFNSSDILKLSIDDTVDIISLNWGNRLYALNLSRIISENKSLNLNAYSSSYHNTMNLINIFKAHSFINEYGVKSSFSVETEQLKTRIGIDAFLDSFDYYVLIADTFTMFDIKRSPFTLSAYIDASYNFNKQFIGQFGLRFDKYQFDEDISINPQTGVKFFLTDYLAMTLSLAKYSQYITSIRQEDNSFASIFGEMWLPIESLYKPQECIHTISGVEYYLTDDLFITGEFYKKDYPRILYTTLGQLMINREHPEYSYTESSAKSSGYEIMLKSTYSRFSGWLGYSYSKTLFFKDSSYVLPYYDKTHNFNLTFTLPLFYKLFLTVSGNYGSGLPYTAVVGKYRNYFYSPATDSVGVAGWNEIQSGYNESRFPAYKRVDISLARKFKIDQLSLKINLSIINLFNFRNVYFYYYDHEATPSVRYEFTMLPIVPSIGVSGEF